VRLLRSSVALLDLAFVLTGIVLFPLICSSQDQTLPSQRSTEPASSDPCCIQRGDELQISVWGEPDLSRSVIVSVSGFISMPLLGDVPVAGLTAKRVRELLAERLKHFLTSPQVDVSVRSKGHPLTVPPTPDLPPPALPPLWPLVPC